MITIPILWERTAELQFHIIEKCDNCTEKQAPGLTFDTSNEEYGPAHICWKCIEAEKKIFNEEQQS